jgi:hypothetical protein
VTPQKDPAPPTQHPIGTPRGMAPLAANPSVAAWLSARGLFPPTSKAWRVTIALDVVDRPAPPIFSRFADTRLHMVIQSAQWELMFCHGDRVSTLVVSNGVATARDRDEHRLAGVVPGLPRIGALVRELEHRYGIFFQRHHAGIESDLPGSEPIIRAWVSSL